MAWAVPDSLHLSDWRLILILTWACIASGYYIRRKKSPRLPPGPRGLPIIGNVLDIPTEKHWLKFTELAEVWGDIFSLTAFGQTMIIVSSLRVAEDLLDVRGANFSDRPVIPMGGELAGFNNVLPLCHYGDRVRKERKLLHQLFGTQAAVERVIPLFSTEIQKLLRNIVLNPDGLVDDIRRATGAITLRIAYGYHLSDGLEHDPILEMFETAGNNFFISTTPAAFLCGIGPNGCQGGFHTTAKMWSKQLHDTADAGLNYVKTEMAAGTAESSFLSTLLEEKSQEDCLLKWAAISIEVGGSGTAAAQLEAFFLAMTLYPDVQATAQRELDRVVGNDRLPDISDRPQLPYVDALCKEVIRWHVVAPLTFPHRTREDCIYDRGGGTGTAAHSEELADYSECLRYANPMVFNPSRFIATESREVEEDPARICFGYGRRICPGELLGKTAIFLECSAILSVFNISKARENGVIVEPQFLSLSADIQRHICSQVLPFKCDVEPRSARALNLIQSS
ncbi:Cytochrome P450 [Mycena venus]|uniref:Cytochrome P450 n=1 Tax=Mycena venus TaxID=2733690 RepID=A0A8H6U470_9AGAR|nr:Cytochrome P450 [Mycena venus]